MPAKQSPTNATNGNNPTSLKLPSIGSGGSSSSTSAAVPSNVSASVSSSTSVSGTTDVTSAGAAGKMKKKRKKYINAFDRAIGGGVSESETDGKILNENVVGNSNIATTTVATEPSKKEAKSPKNVTARKVKKEVPVATAASAKSKAVISPSAKNEPRGRKRPNQDDENKEKQKNNVPNEPVKKRKVVENQPQNTTSTSAATKPKTLAMKIATSTTTSTSSTAAGGDVTMASTTSSTASKPMKVATVAKPTTAKVTTSAANSSSASSSSIDNSNTEDAEKSADDLIIEKIINENPHLSAEEKLAKLPKRGAGRKPYALKALEIQAKHEKAQRVAAEALKMVKEAEQAMLALKMPKTVEKTMPKTVEKTKTVVEKTMPKTVVEKTKTSTVVEKTGSKQSKNSTVTVTAAATGSGEPQTAAVKSKSVKAKDTSSTTVTATVATAAAKSKTTTAAKKGKEESKDVVPVETSSSSSKSTTNDASNTATTKAMKKITVQPSTLLKQTKTTVAAKSAASSTNIPVQKPNEKNVPIKSMVVISKNGKPIKTIASAAAAKSKPETTTSTAAAKSSSAAAKTTKPTKAAEPIKAAESSSSANATTDDVDECPSPSTSEINKKGKGKRSRVVMAAKKQLLTENDAGKSVENLEIVEENPVINEVDSTTTVMKKAVAKSSKTAKAAAKKMLGAKTAQTTKVQEENTENDDKSPSTSSKVQESNGTVQESEDKSPSNSSENNGNEASASASSSAPMMNPLTASLLENINVPFPAPNSNDSSQNSQDSRQFNNPLSAGFIRPGTYGSYGTYNNIPEGNNMSNTMNNINGINIMPMNNIISIGSSNSSMGSYGMVSSFGPTGPPGKSNNRLSRVNLGSNPRNIHNTNPASAMSMILLQHQAEQDRLLKQQEEQERLIREQKEEEEERERERKLRMNEKLEQKREKERIEKEKREKRAEEKREMEMRKREIKIEEERRKKEAEEVKKEAERVKKEEMEKQKQEAEKQKKEADAQKKKTAATAAAESKTNLKNSTPEESDSNTRGKNTDTKKSKTAMKISSTTAANTGAAVNPKIKAANPKTKSKAKSKAATKKLRDSSAESLTVSESDSDINSDEEILGDIMESRKSLSSVTPVNDDINSITTTMKSKTEAMKKSSTTTKSSNLPEEEENTLVLVSDANPKSSKTVATKSSMAKSKAAAAVDSKKKQHANSEVFLSAGPTSGTAPLSRAERAAARNFMKDCKKITEVENKNAKIHNDGTTVTAKDILKLRSGAWLNDELVNDYRNLCLTDIPAHLGPSSRPRIHIWPSQFWQFFTNTAHQKFKSPINRDAYREKFGPGNTNSSYSVGDDQDPSKIFVYSNIEKWTTKQRLNIFSDLDVMLFPVNNDGVHWSLGGVDFRSAKIFHICSQGQRLTKFEQGIKYYLQKEWENKVLETKKAVAEQAMLSKMGATTGTPILGINPQSGLPYGSHVVLTSSSSSQTPASSSAATSPESSPNLNTTTSKTNSKKLSSMKKVSAMKTKNSSSMKNSNSSVMKKSKTSKSKNSKTTQSAAAVKAVKANIKRTSSSVNIGRLTPRDFWASQASYFTDEYPDMPDFANWDCLYTTDIEDMYRPSKSVKKKMLGGGNNQGANGATNSSPTLSNMDFSMTPDCNIMVPFTEGPGSKNTNLKYRHASILKIPRQGANNFDDCGVFMLLYIRTIVERFEEQRQMQCRDYISYLKEQIEDAEEEAKERAIEEYQLKQKEEAEKLGINLDSEVKEEEKGVNTSYVKKPLVEHLSVEDLLEAESVVAEEEVKGSKRKSVGKISLKKSSSTTVTAAALSSTTTGSSTSTTGGDSDISKVLVPAAINLKDLNIVVDYSECDKTPEEIVEIEKKMKLNPEILKSAEIAVKRMEALEGPKKDDEEDRAPFIFDGIQFHFNQHEMQDYRKRILIDIGRGSLKNYDSDDESS